MTTSPTLSNIANNNPNNTKRKNHIQQHKNRKEEHKRIYENVRKSLEKFAHGYPTNDVMNETLTPIQIDNHFIRAQNDLIEKGIPYEVFGTNSYFDFTFIGFGQGIQANNRTLQQKLKTEWEKNGHITESRMWVCLEHRRPNTQLTIMLYHDRLHYIQWKYKCKYDIVIPGSCDLSSNTNWQSFQGFDVKEFGFDKKPIKAKITNIVIDRYQRHYVNEARRKLNEALVTARYPEPLYDKKGFKKLFQQEQMKNNKLFNTYDGKKLRRIEKFLMAVEHIFQRVMEGVIERNQVKKEILTASAFYGGNPLPTQLRLTQKMEAANTQKMNNAQKAVKAANKGNNAKQQGNNKPETKTQNNKPETIKKVPKQVLIREEERRRQAQWNKRLTRLDHLGIL